MFKYLWPRTNSTSGGERCRVRAMEGNMERDREQHPERPRDRQRTWKGFEKESGNTSTLGQMEMVLSVFDEVEHDEHLEVIRDKKNFSC